MQQDQIKTIVLSTLYEIAPELGEQNIDPKINFRDQFDFDSVDFLSFALSLQKRLNIKIPEIDYPKLSSLEGCMNYLHGMAGME